jgi:hypothetical protein
VWVNFVDASVVAFNRSGEGLSHSVALRTFDGRRYRFKTDVASEAAGVAGNVAAADNHSMVSGKRLTLPNRCSTAATIRSRMSLPEMPAVVAKKLMAPRSQQSSAKATPHPLAIVAADLEAIGAPAPIAFIDRDTAIMPRLDTASMAIEQQAMDLHHPVDPLVMVGFKPGQRPTFENGVDPPVAVGRQFSDHRLDLRCQCRIKCAQMCRSKNPLGMLSQPVA